MSDDDLIVIFDTCCCATTQQQDALLAELLERESFLAAAEASDYQAKTEATLF